MRRVNNSLASGPDGIPSYFWKKLASVLSLPVSILFTASYHFSVLPSDWTCAFVQPLFKKNDPSNVSNYRPISLTSALCKVMETIVKDNLIKFAVSHKILNENQHGFVPGKSTCSQILEALYDWTSGLDVGDIYDVVTIDFRKAFDVIPHDILVHKLIAVGVCEQSVRWIASFLSSRKQCIFLNRKYSSISDVPSGIVQGSVIGPLLFALYINDLPECCPDCKIKLFADDVKAYKKIRICNDRLALQYSLNNISTWAKKNKLGISVEKCCYFRVGYSNFTLVYMLDSDHIAPCDSIVDLGIHINSSLKFGQHCTAVVSKASASSKLIVKTFLSCDPRVMCRAFITYVRPLMKYYTPV